MNIFLREIKAHRKSLFFWCIGIFLMVSSGMGKFETAKASGQSMNDIISAMPKSLRVLFGLNSVDISTVLGYYSIILSYLVLMAAIHASMLGSNIISKEERDKTSEFLMVKPVSRRKIISSKLLAALFNIIVFNVVTLLSSIMMVGYYSKSESFNDKLIIFTLGLFILQIIYLFIGTGISSISKNSKSAPSIATGILLGSFILSLIIDFNEKLEVLKYLTPFKYFETKNLLTNTYFDALFVILSILIIAVFLLVTYIFYNKRDLNI